MDKLLWACCLTAGLAKLSVDTKLIANSDKHPTMPFLQVNLLHPLALLKWSEYSKIPVDVYNAQAVVLGNKVYIGRIVHDAWVIIQAPCL